MNAAAKLTVDAIDGTSLDRYTGLLQATFDSDPPPFGTAAYGDHFYAHARHPDWLAGTLAQNAQVEGDGARKLQDLVSRVADPALTNLIWRHAVDESNHARHYESILYLVFPDVVVDPDTAAALHRASPSLRLPDPPAESTPSSDAVIYDELIQMNIGEIRTRIHHCLFTSVLVQIVPETNKDRLARLLDTILADETNHIAYTARLIDSKTADPEWYDWALACFAQRTREFNELTVTQVGAH